MDKTQDYIKRAVLVLLILVAVIGFWKGLVSAFEDLPNRIAETAPKFN
ncbi:hypothetical protein MKZ15_15485 [Paenibacillus sp. FSL R7-0216]